MPNIKKFLAIDYGQKRIGIAVGDSQNRIALPYKIITNKDKNSILAELKNIIQQEEISALIVGLPYKISDKQRESQQMREAQKFVGFLKEKLNIKIKIEDERLTTKIADGLLKGSKIKQRDDVAAAIILQGYLERM